MVQIIQRGESPYGEQLATALNALGQQMQESKKNKLLSELLSGGPVSTQSMTKPGGVPSAPAPMDSSRMLQAAKASGANPQELMLLQRQLYQQEKLGEQRKSLELQRERSESAEAKEYLSSLRKRVEPATDLYETVNEVKAILQNPNLQIGPIKSLVPSSFQNSETQALVSKLNEIVTKKSQLGKGVPSKMRLQLEQLSKPQIWQRPETIKKLINSLATDLEGTLLEDDIKNDIIEKMGRTPRNLESLVKKRLKIVKGLPSASDFSDDAVIEVGGKQFERSGNSWIPVGE